MSQQIGLSLFIVGVWCATLFGQIQVQVPQPAAESGGDGNGVIVTSDRDLRLSLDKAQKMVTDERYDEAVTILESILRNSSDSFYKPDFSKNYYRSIRSQVRQILGQLPPAGLESFELNFGPTAERNLRQLISEGKLNKLSDIIRTYFHTPAGQEATWIFGRLALDHGQPYTAATHLQMLYQFEPARKKFEPALSKMLVLAWWRAGYPEKTLPILKQLRTESPDGLEWQQTKHAWFKDDKEVNPWLAQVLGQSPELKNNDLTGWNMFGGNPARNGRVNTGSPLLNPRWEVTLQESTANKTATQSQLEKQLSITSRLPMPIYQPLAMGNTILLPKNNHLQGIDFRTGKLKWIYPPLIGAPTAIPEPAKTQVQTMDGRMISLSSLMTTARLNCSSDANQAYFVEESPVPINPSRAVIFAGGVRNNNTSQIVTNVLSALNLEKEGYLRWQVGGLTGESEPALAGAYFYGAPLVVHDELYIIGEISSELNLFCLSPATGQLIWSQPLIRYELPLTADYTRRLHHAVPSYADGVMICPTNYGMIVAVDIHNRCLLWLQSYQQSINEYGSAIAMRRMIINNGGVMPNQSSTERWLDGVASISQGKIVITPVDGDDLYCLDMQTGKEIWRVRKNDFADRTPLYVAHFENDRIAVVGKSSISILNISQKKVTSSISYGTGLPSGRGYLSGDAYHLPVNTGEVLKLDLAKSKLVARTKSRDKVTPGNLIAHQGQVISLNSERAYSFHSLETRQEWVKTTLQKTPDDPDALQALGEIELNSGNLAEAILNLEKSWEKQPSDPVRLLLSEALLQAMKQDFQAYESKVPLLKKLIAVDSQREILSRLLVEQYLNRQEMNLALEEILQLCSVANVEELEESEPGKLSLRRDRWLVARLQAASKKTDAVVMEKFYQDLQTRLTASIQNNPQSAKLLNHLTQLLITDQARLQLTKSLVEQKQYLDAELQLLKLQKTGQFGAAWEIHASMLTSLERNQDVLALAKYMSLPVNIGEVKPGLNTKQYAEQLLAQEKLTPLNDNYLNWSTQPVKKETVPGSQNTYRFPVEIHTDNLPFHQQGRLEMTQGQEFSYTDPTGKILFKIPVSELYKQPTNYGVDQNMMQARFVGHLFLVNAGFSVAAFDTLQIENNRPKLLWKFDVNSILGEERQNFRYRQVQQANGRVRIIPMDSQNRTLCNIALASRELVCIARLNKLFALDTRTGEIVWVRHDVRGSGDIVGDENTISLFVEQSNEVVSYNAIDGQELGVFKVPTENQRVALLGSKLLSSETINAKQVLKLTNLRDGQVLWQNEYAVNAKVTMIDREYCAVFEQRGLLSIVNLKQGELLFSSNLNPEASVIEYQVTRDLDRFLVVIGRSFGNKPNTYINPLNYGSYQARPFTGYCYGINASNGKLQWERKVEEVCLIQLQPTASPALLFGAFINKTENNGTGRQFTKVVAVDKRSGELIYDEQSQNGSGQVYVTMTTENRQLNVHTGNQSIRLIWEPLTALKPLEQPKL